MMKALVLNSVGNIKVKEVEIPNLIPGWVRIKVRAAGVCGSDIPRIYETGAHKMPLIIGHEFAGVVDALGPQVPDHWLKKRVGVYPLIPCMKCESCKNGHYEACNNYDYIGSRRDGAFAEYVNVPANNLIELPDEVSFDDAAMLEPLAVAEHAVRAGLEGMYITDNDKAIVCGLGPIGCFVAMLLKEKGINVYTIGNKTSQKQRMLNIGIDDGHYYDSSDDLTKLEGARLFFECVGASKTINLSIELTAPMGRAVMVGNPKSDINFAKDNYWKILRKQLNIVGIWNSRFCDSTDDDWHQVLGLLKDAKITPSQFITHKVPLEDVLQMLDAMHSKTADFCKVLVVNE